MVRPVTGSAATRAYRCPGCDQEIRPATPHVVVWPKPYRDVEDLAEADEQERLAERRHWHTACWRARDRRRPRLPRRPRGSR